MAEIVLVRHGQANSGAIDESSYDQLSDLGHRQARLLGAHMVATNPHFDHVICGDMRRHKETAREMGYAPRLDRRWNELDYFSLSRALEAKTGLPYPGGGGGFFTHLDYVFSHWRANSLDGVPETYAAFETRVVEALHAVAHQGGRSLVVTSAGVIAIVVTYVLGLGHTGQIKIIFQTSNTSVHRIEWVQNTFYIAEFGTTPHLDQPDRWGSRTFY